MFWKLSINIRGPPKEMAVAAIRIQCRPQQLCDQSLDEGGLKIG